MFSARGRAGRPVTDDPVATHALALAGELSDTVRRERATARSLAEYLASGAPEASRDGEHRPSSGVDLRCLACNETIQAPVDDVDGTVDEARAFFSQHDRCRCEIDLTDTAAHRRRAVHEA